MLTLIRTYNFPSNLLEAIHNFFKRRRITREKYKARRRAINSDDNAEDTDDNKKSNTVGTSKKKDLNQLDGPPGPITLYPELHTFLYDDEGLKIPAALPEKIEKDEYDEIPNAELAAANAMMSDAEANNDDSDGNIDTPTTTKRLLKRKKSKPIAESEKEESVKKKKKTVEEKIPKKSAPTKQAEKTVTRSATPTKKQKQPKVDCNINRPLDFMSGITSEEPKIEKSEDLVPQVDLPISVSIPVSTETTQPASNLSSPKNIKQVSIPDQSNVKEEPAQTTDFRTFSPITSVDSQVIEPIKPIRSINFSSDGELSPRARFLQTLSKQPKPTWHLQSNTQLSDADLAAQFEIDEDRRPLTLDTLKHVPPSILASHLSIPLTSSTMFSPATSLQANQPSTSFSPIQSQFAGLNPQLLALLQTFQQQRFPQTTMLQNQLPQQPSLATELSQSSALKYLAEYVLLFQYLSVDSSTQRLLETLRLSFHMTRYDALRTIRPQFSNIINRIAQLDAQINEFVDPTMRPLVEQFVSSKLSLEVQKPNGMSQLLQQVVHPMIYNQILTLPSPLEVAPLNVAQLQILLNQHNQQFRHLSGVTASSYLNDQLMSSQQTQQNTADQVHLRLQALLMSMQNPTRIDRPYISPPNDPRPSLLASTVVTTQPQSSATTKNGSESNQCVSLIGATLNWILLQHA